MTRSRPYRSRRIPACIRCRARRSRCVVNIIGQACRQCQQDDIVCSSALSKTRLQRTPIHAFSPESHTASRPQANGTQIMPPVVARDTQILEEILPSSDNNLTSSQIGDTAQRSVFHVSIPPRRPSPASCECLRKPSAQFAIQVEPFLTSMVEFYITDLHPCLPMLDTTTLQFQLASNNQYPRTFLTNFAAYVLFYWSTSTKGPRISLPDQDFAWQVACSALNADIQTSGILAIQAAVFSIAGRPSKGVVHNMTNVARIVTLSYSIGLNHDCSKWRLTEAEKRTRWRLWWVVLIHDRWFHFAQGTPPLVNAAHYDVPLPTLGLLLGSSDVDERATQAAECYMAFCRLTEIVGDVLPLVYHVRSGTMQSIGTQRSKSQSDLNHWYSNIPDLIDLSQFAKRSQIPGLVNLQIAYLATCMLLARLSWHEDNQSTKSDDGEAKLRECMSAAQRVVEFALSLDETELVGFWLPYNIQHFTSATTLLLRCALQTKDRAMRDQCVVLSCDLASALERYQNVCKWDLAETALSTSAQLLSRVKSALPKLSELQSHRQDSVRDGHAARNETLSRYTVDCSSDLNIGDITSIDPMDASLDQLFPDLFASLIDYPTFE